MMYDAKYLIWLSRLLRPLLHHLMSWIVGKCVLKEEEEGGGGFYAADLMQALLLLQCMLWELRIAVDFCRPG